MERRNGYEVTQTREKLGTNDLRRRVVGATVDDAVTDGIGACELEFGKEVEGKIERRCVVRAPAVSLEGRASTSNPGAALLVSDALDSPFCKPALLRHRKRRELQGGRSRVDAQNRPRGFVQGLRHVQSRISGKSSKRSRT
jgi:hypothetical protein